MSKPIRKILLLLGVLIVFILVAPRFLRLDQVQEEMTDWLRETLHSKTDISALHWVWLPLPHLVMEGTVLDNRYLTLELPTANIYPDWFSLFQGKTAIGRISLDRPECRLKVVQPSLLPATDRILPGIDLAITNGSILIPPPEDGLVVFRQKRLPVTALRGDIRLSPHGIDFRVRAQTSASSLLTLAGSYRLDTRAYAADYTVRRLKLDREIDSLAYGVVRPAASTVNLEGKINGSGLADFRLNLEGTLPSFTVRHAGREIALGGGRSKLNLSGTDHGIELEVIELTLPDPSLRINGRVARLVDGPEAKPEWLLDLHAADIDVAAVRKRILTLWPEHRIARRVCDIVRGGRIRSAAYYFRAPAAGFKKLENMFITADVPGADIHVPVADLSLTKARGSISIQNGRLTGSGLEAEMGGSRGRNCDLLLDLTGTDKRFQLDLDLEVELAALPPVLHRLIKHTGFRSELAGFKDLSGKASGHLTIGDRLADPATRVSVTSMQATGRYNRLPAPFTVHSGRLDIVPGRVDWRRAAVDSGRLRIETTSGNVDWRKTHPQLAITSLKAETAFDSLFAILRGLSLLPRHIEEQIGRSRGILAIDKGTLRGPAASPSAWQYEFILRPEELDLRNRNLPEPLLFQRARAILTEDRLTLENTDAEFLGQTIELAGRFQHHEFTDWRGWLEVNGILRQRLADWLKKTNRLPAPLFPRVPCTLQNLRLDYDGNILGVDGTIIAGNGEAPRPLARLKARISPHLLRIDELRLAGPHDQARLSLQLHRRGTRRLEFSWQGTTSDTTIHRLFEDTLHVAGSISGAFSLAYTPAEPAGLSFSGFLKAGELRLSKKEDASFRFLNLNLNGDGDRIDIAGLTVSTDGAKAEIIGRIDTTPGIELNLTARSSELSADTLERLISELHNLKRIIWETEAGDETVAFRQLRGRIDFRINSFGIERRLYRPEQRTDTQSYTLNRLRGQVELLPTGATRTVVASGRLCGLELTGTWHSDDRVGKRFQLSAPPTEPLLMEDVIPCLGFEQNLIEGRFTLQSRLRWRDGGWTGGNITIISDSGRILRLKLLSRIFSVVNLTDLFTQDTIPGLAGREGFPYSQLNLEMHVQDNRLLIDKAVIHGEGLNLFARGHLRLDDLYCDLTVLIAPFKTLDSLIARVPLIGPTVGGEQGSRATIPVAIRGHIEEPAITILPPEAIGDAMLNLVKDTLMLPFTILDPILSTPDETDQTPAP